LLRRIVEADSGASEELVVKSKEGVCTRVAIGQVLGLVTILVAVGTVLTLAGLAFAGTSITVLLASPVLLFFSPILVPLAIIAFFSIGSLLGFGGFVSFVVWAYKYYKGGSAVKRYDAIDAAPEERARGITSNTATVE
jgi:hypothetical protein